MSKPNNKIELVKTINELKETLAKYKKDIQKYDNQINSYNDKLKEYMRMNKFDNATISRYSNINNLFDLSHTQSEIKDISILKHIINTLEIKESKNNMLELERNYQKLISKKQVQLTEFEKFGRIFTA